MIENEDCTTDWLAVNAPDYYGFYPSQEVVSKVMRLMQTIKNPNDVIWHSKCGLEPCMSSASVPC